jgi:nucleoside phosphorylase
VVVARTGEGQLRAARGVAALLDAVRVSRLLVLGVSGSLDPALRPGALIVGRGALRPDADVPAPDPEWLDAVLRRKGATPTTLVTTPRILCTPDEKSAAREKLWIAGPAAVDLETAAYAEAAASRGLPWLALRAISDGVDESLPLDFNRFRDEDGCIRRERVIAHALRHPSSVSGLRRMRRRVAGGARELAAFAHGLLNETREVNP